MYIVTTTERGKRGGGGGIDEKKIDARGLCSFLYSDPLFKRSISPCPELDVGDPEKTMILLIGYSQRL